LGLIGKFPVEIRPLAKPATRSAVLQLSAPVRLEGDIYRYHLQGDGLRGMISGELAFALTRDAAGISKVSSGIKSSRLVRSYEAAAGRLEVAFSATDPAEDGSFGFLDIDVVHSQGHAEGVLQLSSAYLNEGRIIGPGFLSRALDGPGAAAMKQVEPEIRKPLLIGASEIRLQVPQGKALDLFIVDSRGKRVLSRHYAAAPDQVKVPLAALPEGMLWIRAVFPGGSRSFPFANVGP
jgi:hypothetical protein